LAFNWQNAKNRSAKVVKKLTAGVSFLLQKNGVEVIQGEARINDAHSVSVNHREISAKNIILATGSYPAPLGLDLPEGQLVQVENLLDLESIPDRLVLVGRGPFALELAQFFKLIDKQVTLVSPSEQMLPGLDPFLRDFILKKVAGQGIKIIAGKSLQVKEPGILDIENEESIAFDQIINCSWRKAIIPDSSVELDLDEDGFIAVNNQLKTSVSGIFAIGDVNGLSYLAHVASAQGIFVINHLHGVAEQLELTHYPVNVYTVPELSQIGLTEEQIREKGIDYKIGEFPMTANGKALAEDAGEGFIRILSEKKFGEVLGVQIVAANATDLIAEAAAFMSVEATVYDVARTVHAHPTVSEVFLEAGMDAADKPIHK